MSVHETRRLRACLSAYDKASLDLLGVVPTMIQSADLAAL